ncbi:exonuclease SbcCD subunit D [Aureibacillus halotolerans]|uniref:Nuclease SbcCD subunit D n=1 Tax=Aureibacillus halotolerans TaxID=1508390 RepID=A0A4R6U6C8_9BACI|nr:exonuclease SbcCD subunit D [Aureibacillus halotolerans]TDQ42070.1 exodeoxyribonuclease I subunit D [Aureibacillus halotolerans]
MRLLHTADWHLGKSLEGRDRFAEQESFLEELIQIAEDQKVDAIVMAGDVFDSVNPPAHAERLFYDYAQRMASSERPLFVIAGNHDHPERLSAAEVMAKSSNIHIWGAPVPEVRTVAVGRDRELLQLAVLPYPSESRLKASLTDELNEKDLQLAYDQKLGVLFDSLNDQFRSDCVRIATSHVFAIGGTAEGVERPIEVGGAYTIGSHQFPINAQYVALGHLHRAQTLKGNVPIRYAGSPLAYSFSESQHAKSVTIIEATPDKAATWEEVYVNSGRPLVRWEADEGLSQVFKWLDEGKDADAWIDLKLFTNEALSMETIHQLRKAHEGIVHIQPIFPEQQAAKQQANRASLPIDDMFHAFYRKQTGGAEVTEDVLALFLELVGETEEVNERETSLTGN